MGKADFALEKIPLDDSARTPYSNANTTAIFQFESRACATW